MLSNTKTTNVSTPKNNQPVDEDYSSDSKDDAAGSDKENTAPDEIEDDIQYGGEPEGPTLQARRLAEANIRYHGRVLGGKSSEWLHDTQERSHTNDDPELNKSATDKGQLAEEEPYHKAEQSPRADSMPSPDQDHSGTYMPSGSEPDDEASESTSSVEKEEKRRRCKSSTKASSTPAPKVESDSDAPRAAHRRRSRPVSSDVDPNMYGTSSFDRVKRGKPIDGSINVSRKRKCPSEEPVGADEDDVAGVTVENQVDFTYSPIADAPPTPIAGPSYADPIADAPTADPPVAAATTRGIEADVDELEAALDNAHMLLQRLKKRVGKM